MLAIKPAVLSAALLIATLPAIAQDSYYRRRNFDDGVRQGGQSGQYYNPNQRDYQYNGYTPSNNAQYTDQYGNTYNRYQTYSNGQYSNGQYNNSQYGNRRYRTTQRVDAYGQPIDANGYRVDANGRRIDANGRYSNDPRYNQNQGGIGPGKGALIGAGAGGILGALFGGGLKGALIGGAVGGGIGAAVGEQKQNTRRRNNDYYAPR